jgi:hypothetical protein
VTRTAPDTTSATSADAADRAVIEQAKGILILRYGIASPEAHATLTQWSHDAGVTLIDLAAALVRGVGQGQVTPAETGLVRWLERRLREEIGGDETAAGSDMLPEASPQAPADTAPAQAPRPPQREVPDIGVLKRWRYSSAVHAARAVCRA